MPIVLLMIWKAGSQNGSPNFISQLLAKWSEFRYVQSGTDPVSHFVKGVF